MARTKKSENTRINLPEAEVALISVEDLTLVDADSEYADILYIPSRHETGGTGWNDFVNSVKSGIINPLIAFETEEGEYLIGAGRRRYLAAQAAELDEVPVRVYAYDENLAMQVMVEENSQRLDDDFLTKVDLVNRFRSAKKGYAEIGELFGVSHQTIRDWEAISKLPKKIVDAIQNGIISTTVALRLTKVDEADVIASFDKMMSAVSVDGGGKKVKVADAEDVASGKAVGTSSNKPTPAQLKLIATDKEVPLSFRLFINAVLGELTLKQVHDMDTEGELDWLVKWPKVEAKKATKKPVGKAAKRVASKNSKKAGPRPSAKRPINVEDVDSSMFE